MFRATSPGNVAPLLVPGRIARLAEARADAIALEADGTLYSRRELMATADRIAAALRPSTRHALVAVYLPRSARQIAALLACWRAGAAYLPLDPAWPEARCAQLVERAGVDSVIAPRGGGTAIAGGRHVIDPDQVEAVDFTPATVSADDLAYVIFTSGSSGEPKAVEVTHANLAALVDWHLDVFQVRPGTRTSHLAGLGFDAAAWESWPTLGAGGTLALVDEAVRTDAPRLRDWLIERRVEIAFAPTALAEPLISLAWPTDPALRLLLTGADKLTRRPPADLPFALVNNYGVTEATVVSTSGRVSPGGEGLPSIGTAITGTAIHLLDPAGEPVTEGSPGEICIGGPQVARGYRGDPGETGRRFIDHPRLGRLYRTGDLALRDAGGELAFLGRLDGQVKIRGHRVEPAEVAAALWRVPGVAEAAVAARDGALVAYLVGAAGLCATELRQVLATSLPDYMIPARFARLDALPLTTSGKVDARALPDPEAHALPEAAAGRAPATPTEEQLYAMVADVIGRTDFGVDDDFFLLGGHSLLGTQVIVRARDAFGVELTLFHLFEARSVAALAATVEALIVATLDAMSDEDIRRWTA